MNLDRVSIYFTQFDQNRTQSAGLFRGQIGSTSGLKFRQLFGPLKIGNSSSLKVVDLQSGVSGPELENTDTSV